MGFFPFVRHVVNPFFRSPSLLLDALTLFEYEKNFFYQILFIILSVIKIRIFSLNTRKTSSIKSCLIILSVIEISFVTATRYGCCHSKIVSS